MTGGASAIITLSRVQDVHSAMTRRPEMIVRVAAALAVAAIAACSGCAEQPPSQLGRSKPDTATGTRILTDSIQTWFQANVPDLQQTSTVTSKAVESSNNFHLASEVRRNDTLAGQVQIDITRPTVARSKLDCTGRISGSCAVTHVGVYTVMATSPDIAAPSQQRQSIEVADSSDDYLALLVESAAPDGTTAPLSKNQAISLIISCVDKLN